MVWVFAAQHVLMDPATLEPDIYYTQLTPTHRRTGKPRLIEMTKCVRYFQAKIVW